MTDRTRTFRLDGLEPDNLLAFLALIGLLRAIDADDRTRDSTSRLEPRASWELEPMPIRPRLTIRVPIDRSELFQRIDAGINLLAEAHDFEGRGKPDYTHDEARELLVRAAIDARPDERDRADVLAALVSDAALKGEKDDTVDATPLCLMFGQGHQLFLERLAAVPRTPVPANRSKGRKAITAESALEEALFDSWRRIDDSRSSFRWDPEEDVRYALMAGDPTDGAYSQGTQHGANRLAALGLGALVAVPVRRGSRARVNVLAGRLGREFTFAWPIWPDPARLASIRALLAHPALREPGGLAHLGVVHVFEARRISVGKFLNFTRARVLAPV